MLSLANGNLLRGAGVRRILRVCCKQLHLSGKARMASGKLVPASRLDGLDKSYWVELATVVAQTKSVNLGQGMPDFSPPQFLVDALVEATKTTAGHQHTRSQGHPRLVKALANMFSILHGRAIDPMTEVIITLGAYTSLAHVFTAFLQPGDEIIIIEPYFDRLTEMSGAKAVYVPLRPQGKFPGSSKDWSLDRQELEAAFSSRTKMILFNTPNNPCGKVFTRAELEMVADLCKRHDVICVSDEVYEVLIYSGSEHCRIATLPGMWERTVTIGSAGKTFCATGWKTGWSVGPEYLIKHLQTVNENCGHTMATPIQEALAVGFEIEASRLGHPDSYFKQLPQMLEKKRDETVAVLREVGMEPIVPEGGYFIMADTSPLGLNFDESQETYDFQFAKWMMKEKGIASVPTSIFYSADHASLSGKCLRFCFCKKDTTLQEAYKRLRQWAEEQNTQKSK